jgi:hypothetical protein
MAGGRIGGEESPIAIEVKLTLSSVGEKSTQIVLRKPIGE